MSTNTEQVTLNIDNKGIATVTLNRPEVHNAFNPEMIAQLTECFEQVHESRHVRVMILAAKGKSFCAGADLGWMKDMAQYSYEENKQDAQKLAMMFNTLYHINKPTIARVQGSAFGGAVGLISCCDIAIASKLSKFCFSEVKLGLAPATIAPYVIDSIGAKAAKRYFMTAEVISARRARRIGLLSETVSEEELDSSIDLIASGILKNGPEAIAMSKDLVNKIKHHAIDQQVIEQTSNVIASARVSAEGQEGLQAFFDKRPADWSQL